MNAKTHSGKMPAPAISNAKKDLSKYKKKTMVSVTNPLMDSEIWGANLAGECVVCRSNKVFTPHLTISTVPLPDATLARLIRPTSSRTSLPPEVLILMGCRCKKACSLSRLFGLWSVIEGLLATSWLALQGRCWRNVLSLRSSRTSPPPEVLILMGFKCKKACSLSRLFRIWSVIEDSNLRPPSSRTKCATEAAPITECGAHLTAQIRPRQSLNSKMPFDRRESQQAA